MNWKRRIMMKQSKINNYVLLFLLGLYLTGCSGLKHLPEDQKLYTGAEIKVVSEGKINKKAVKKNAMTGVRPAPNKKFLGMRPKLWMYLTAGDNPKTKIKKWLRKHGEAPVLLRNVKPRATAEIIDAKLFNVGIFKSYSEYKIVEKKRTAKVVYTSHVHAPYKIKEVTYAVGDERILETITKEKKKSLIKPGKDYNLDILKNERVRLDAILKNNGYFYFNPDFLVYKADTSAADYTVSLKLTIKDSIPENALNVCRIHSVTIDQDYSLMNRAGKTPKDTTIYENNIFLSRKSGMNIKPKAILRSVYLRKDEIYSRQNHNITLNRLMSLGTFKFVQVKFADSDTLAPGFLDVTVLLTNMSKRSFKSEVDMVSKSNKYTGPRLDVTLLNRNTFGGAEMLNMGLAGSFEAQLSGQNKNLYTYSFNPKVELTFPRIILPVNLKRSNSMYTPKTQISFAYNYLRRVDYFSLQTFQLIYGFKWKENILKEHELNPINASYTSIGNQTDTFKLLLASNPYLKKSYEEQFIAGLNYSFTYNEQVLQGKKIQFYFQGNAETAGNVFSLIKTISGQKPSSENPRNIFGSIYSQYAKFSIDTRGFYNFSEKTKLAMRFFAGIGKPYGNSSLLPYTKQFFSGGPNSIRAFQINSVGPGTYSQKNNNQWFLQLGGDIKLELNSEYRFNIYKFLKGALFVDAGNVWLEKSNPANIGSPFVFSNFMKELAVGSGFGLRFDVSFFILRFDLAFPLRKPWLEENNRWVIDQIDFTNSTWRKENLVLNIAIGYPF